MSNGAERPQFSLIQALRGVAALWVVLFHLEKSAALTGVTAWLPQPVTFLLFQYGRAGVAIFFVLSGFVICHSLSGKPLTGRGVARFAARRSIRLDPPYWASMLLMVAVEAAIALAKHQPLPLPGAGQVLAHVLYLQTLLGVPEIQYVYWTLTYEIQFYIVFALFIWAAGGIALTNPLFGLLYALALGSAIWGAWGPVGLFVNLWHGFFLGVLAYQAGMRRLPVWPLLLLVGATIAGARQLTEIFGLPCALTALLLYAATRTNRLGLLRGRAWQELGAISYSLYLVHVPILRLLTGSLQRLLGRGEVADAIAGLLLLAACIGMAVLLHRAVEGPSKRLASRLFAGRPAPSAGFQTT